MTVVGFVWLLCDERKQMQRYLLLVKFHIGNRPKQIQNCGYEHHYICNSMWQMPTFFNIHALSKQTIVLDDSPQLQNLILGSRKFLNGLTVSQECSTNILF